MRAFPRLVTLALLASHLAVSSLPCPTAKSHGHVPEHAALASAPAHPCPGHADADPDPAAWFDARARAGAKRAYRPAAAPPRARARLCLLAMPGPFVTPGRSPLFAPTVRLAELALAPPEPVPLPIA